ncbi:MAG: shikimate dehydrogenase [Candidatus Levyibacteriota bacterium]|nr:MAG: shikimate dehydrogenase [Candidatus Levybacteria bacterium]
MEINSQTQLCCIIGNPVEHSLSPTIHNAAYDNLGLNFVYLSFRVTDVKNAIAGIRALGIKGISITIPHKITVMPLLDEIDKSAKEIGAVNTIINNNGKLKGFNTDYKGAIRALEEKTTLTGKHVVLLGKGGAGKAIAFGLKEKNASVFIVNRAIEKTKVLAEIKKADILINATPIGMHPKTEESLIPKKYLHKNLIVFDIVYNPKETKLLKYAKEAGCAIVYGYKMLLYQAVSQFELFTNHKAPVAIMEEALLLCLNS